MKKNLLIAIIVILLLGAAITVFAINRFHNNYSEGLELEIDVCPLDLEPEVEVTDC